MMTEYSRSEAALTLLLMMTMVLGLWKWGEVIWFLIKHAGFM